MYRFVRLSPLIFYDLRKPTKRTEVNTAASFVIDKIIVSRSESFPGVLKQLVIIPRCTNAVYSLQTVEFVKLIFNFSVLIRRKW